MADTKDDIPQSRNIYYPLMILVGIAGNILSAFSQLQAIYSTLGIFVSTLLIGVGIIGFFVNQRRISLRDGMLYAIIWTMLMAITVAGYYILISRASSVYGILLDNASTRNPVSGVEVSLYIYSSGATNRVRTDERGEFQFDDVSNGEFDVIINDVSIYSGDIPSGLSKLVETNVNTGRFYLQTLGVVSVTASPVTATPQPTNPVTLQFQDHPTNPVTLQFQDHPATTCTVNNVMNCAELRSITINGQTLNADNSIIIDGDAPLIIQSVEFSISAENLEIVDTKHGGSGFAFVNVFLATRPKLVQRSTASEDLFISSGSVNLLEAFNTFLEPQWEDLGNSRFFTVQILHENHNGNPEEEVIAHYIIEVK
jgi:hypothetical protein